MSERELKCILQRAGGGVATPDDMLALSHEIDRLRGIEKAARELLPCLPPKRHHHIPSNNLRYVLESTNERE